MPMFLFSTNFLPHLTLPSVFDLDFRPEQNGEDAERTVSWHNGALCMKMNGRMRGGRENSAKIISLAEQSKRERKGEERVTSIWEDPSAGLVRVIWQVLLPLQSRVTLTCRSPSRQQYQEMTETTILGFFEELAGEKVA